MRVAGVVVCDPSRIISDPGGGGLPGTPTAAERHDQVVSDAHVSQQELSQCFGLQLITSDPGILLKNTVLALLKDMRCPYPTSRSKNIIMMDLKLKYGQI